MLRSLFAGISGLRVNQTMLDVTGNNIANANTPGFKASSTVFSDTLSQMLTGPSKNSVTANGGRGGTNPIQVGLGVQLGATATNFTQGSNEMTGRGTDLMLQGDGFFVAQADGQTTYTRAGAFSFDDAGYLVTPTGAMVQQVDPATGALSGSIQLPTDAESYSIGADGVLRVVVPDPADATKTVTQPVATLAIARFTNPMGLQKAGSTTFLASAASGGATYGAAGANGNGQVVAGALEMSNVDLAQEFTNLILAQRGFQASSRVITTSDQVLEDLVNIKR